MKLAEGADGKILSPLYKSKQVSFNVLVNIVLIKVDDYFNFIYYFFFGFV